MSDARRKTRNSSPLAPGTAARNRSDTIVAIATAPGRSAVSIIRLSGRSASDIARRCVTPWPARPRELTRCRVREPMTDRHLDDGLVAEFPAPRSYTGETVVEIHSHGGSYVAVAIQAACVTAGARPALPGEFTERAVLNGKLDLISAEAIGELIDARTRATHRAAIQVLSGTLARQYAELRRDAIAVEALIAYDIDFPEEDHGPVARERVDTAAATVEAHLGSLLATTPAVVLGRDGALVVLAGPPNAGKSSLLNALVGESRVIVSDEPGTTRDAIEVLLDTDPWPIRLVDTAGLREDAGVVERLGIEVCERYLKGADVVVVCAETENGLATAAARVRTLTDAPIIEVHTKGDLRRRNGKPGPDAILEVSAINGWRLDALRERILDVIVSRVGRPDDLAPPVASARQRAALDIARNEMVLFRSAWRAGTLPAPVAATHLRAAVDALDHLIGVVDSNDVLDRVFSTFCVGK